MRRWARLWAALAITAAMLAAQPAVAWETLDFAPSVCDAGPEEPIQIVTDDTSVDRTLPRRNRQHIPGPYVDWALGRLPADGVPKPESRREALNALQMFVLETHPKLVALNRAYLVDHGAGDALLQTFDQAVGWLADVCAAPPRHAYDLSKETKNFATPTFAGLLKNALLYLAINRDVAEAIFDWAMRDFRRSRDEEGYQELRLLGNKGHVPALRKLIELAPTNPAVEHPRAETFYWLYRAREAGLDTEKDLRALAPKLTPDDQMWFEIWCRRGWI